MKNIVIGMVSYPLRVPNDVKHHPSDVAPDSGRRVKKRDTPKSYE